MTAPAPDPDPAGVFTARRGTVAAYDEHLGAGTVRDADSAATWPFHCTAVADGTRTVPVGASVTYRVEPGPGGFEAVAVAVSP